ncbi:MAG: 3'-5' exonuclease, partial [Desulfofustis sp.]
CCWSESGLMQMMNQLLEDEQVFLNLSVYPQAERRITNIQHLIELLQQEQSEHRLSASQTVNWFQERISDPAAAQEAELRLESDTEAVNVITMHSAKGLEYEIVFCPFLHRSSLSGRVPESIDCYDPAAGRICDLGSDLFEYHLQLSRQEEIEEEMRLAYVAMTRARLRTYLFWADIKPGPRSSSSFASPLGTLLFPDGCCSAQSQKERIERSGSAEHCLHSTIIPDSALIDYAPQRSAAGSLKARKYVRTRLQTNRVRTSFSGLTMLSRHDAEEPARADDERGAFEPSEFSALPGGVRFGNLVHEALERFAFADLANGLADREALEELISSYRYTIERDAFVDLLERAVTTPLFPPGASELPMSLAEIPGHRQVKEMEFSLHLDHSKP